MTALAYVGRDTEAAAFRLIGAACWAPAASDEQRAWDAARSAADVVLLDAAIAARLPSGELDAALAAARPLLLLVSTDGTVSPLDPAQRVRATLGLEA